MRTLLLVVVTIFLLISNSPALAQKNAKRLQLDVIKHKIDSLKTLKSLINKKLIEIDEQINKLMEIKSKIEVQELSSGQSVFGIVSTDIHMRLTNGEMSKKIKTNTNLLILDYLPEKKKFKVKHQGQIGHLSDSWIHQTPEIIQFKRNKTATIEFGGQTAIVTKTIVAGSLREQPSLSATEIIQIPPGSKITVHNWYQKPYFKVSFGEKIGYLSYGSIKLTKPLQAIVGKTRTKQVVQRTSANPIRAISRSKSRSNLKASLMRDYGSSYSTIEMLLNAGMEAYDKLSNIPSTQVNNRILNDLMKDYYPHFSTILMLFEANKKAYEKLR